jgi:hypothetical protein
MKLLKTSQYGPAQFSKVVRAPFLALKKKNYSSEIYFLHLKTGQCTAGRISTAVSAAPKTCCPMRNKDLNLPVFLSFGLIKKAAMNIIIKYKFKGAV